MKNIFCLAVAAALAFSISSCAYVDQLFAPKRVVELDYLDKTTEIDIKKFFNGDIEAFAIVQDKDGKIVGTYSNKIHGKWEENKGVIQYNLVDDKGNKDNRTWLITLEADNGTFEVVGHDFTKPADGKQIGNAAQMIYALTMRSKEGRIEVKFDDKMYLVDEKSMILVSSFTKENGDHGKKIVSLRKLN